MHYFISEHCTFVTNLLTELVSIASALVWCAIKARLLFSTCPAAPNTEYWEGKKRFNNWLLLVLIKKVKSVIGSPLASLENSNLVVGAHHKNRDLYLWSLPNSQRQQEEDGPWTASTINDRLVFPSGHNATIDRIRYSPHNNSGLVTRSSDWSNYGLWIPAISTRYTQSRQEQTQQPQSAQEKTYLLF